MNPAAEVLLTRAIDYAGQFPPAQLNMAEAVANYRRYITGDDRWALGRLVCAVGRLGELEAALQEGDGRVEPWKVAAVARDAPEADQVAITLFNLKAAGKARVDTVEAKTHTPAEVAARVAAHERLMSFCEVDPAGANWEAMLDAARAHGAKVKLRMGGVVAEAIPPVEQVMAFLLACRRRDLGFKATAGLHHAYGGRYALTYQAGSAQARMHGFVNLTLAIACLQTGGSPAEAERLLRAASPADFAAASVEQLQAARRAFISFGSCSFEEPMQWLRQLP
ncbi:MAG: hypothetical protein ACTHJX_04670 [Terriglobales bacterium]